MSLGFNVATRSKKSLAHLNWIDATEKYAGRAGVTAYICVPVIILGIFDSSLSRLFWVIALIVAIGYIAFNVIQAIRIDNAVFQQRAKEDYDKLLNNLTNPTEDESDNSTDSPLSQQ